MRSFVVRRLLQMVPTFLGITMLTFGVAHLAEGDPLQLDLETPHAGGTATARAAAGLDDPLPVQYGRWLSRVVRLDFGRSLVDRREVSLKLLEALPRTLLLASLALLLAYAIALPLGVFQAARPRALGSKAISVVLFVLASVPGFWVAVMALLAFASPHGVDWLPAQGLHEEGQTGFVDLLLHLILPVSCLSYATLAVVSRQVRSALQRALSQDYVLAARARGVPERRILFGHALRNALLPLITLASLSLPALIGGSVVIERVFGIPGMGSLAFEAIASRDYPVVMAVATLSALITMLAVLAADLSYGLVDPRIRAGRS